MASKDYAVRLLDEIVRKEAQVAIQKTPTLFDLAVVFAGYPDIKLVPASDNVTYTGDEIVWAIDRRDISEGDILVIAYDPKVRPVVLSRADNLNQDPTLHPKGAELEQKINLIFDEARSWKKPVASATLLPLTGNFDGDIRLVLDEDILYRWLVDGSEWVPISARGTGGGTEDALPLAGGTMEGDIIMPSGTMITLEDLPVNGTDAVNKTYVDTLISSIENFVVPTVCVAMDYAVSAADYVVLVDATLNDVRITLPATPETGKIYVVKDKEGMATTNTIDIVSADGDTFDGDSGPLVLTVDYISFTLIFDGDGWRII